MSDFDPFFLIGFPLVTTCSVFHVYNKLPCSQETGFAFDNAEGGILSFQNKRPTYSGLMFTCYKRAWLGVGTGGGWVQLRTLVT